MAETLEVMVVDLFGVLAALVLLKDWVLDLTNKNVKSVRNTGMR